MKKVLALAVSLLFAAVAAPAFADVTVTATIDKDKDITVTETLSKVKVVTIDVFYDQDLEGAAEAEALFNVVNTEGDVDTSEGGSTDLDADIVGSILDNTGLVQFNQDVGNMVNQGNMVSVAGVATRGDDRSFIESQAEGDQVVQDNETQLTGRLEPDNPDRAARMEDSISNNVGVVQVNQNAGNNNNQNNALAAAVGLGDLGGPPWPIGEGSLGSEVAFSEAALGQATTGNSVTDFASVKLDLITGSLIGNQGVVSVNQASGNMNNQGTVISLSAGM